jgi:hypothetical protein
VADGGPAVEGNGNLFAANGDPLVPDIDGNWILAAYADVVRSSTTYRIFRNDEQLVEGLLGSQYRDLAAEIGDHCYEITATYVGDPFFTSVKSSAACVFAKSRIEVRADNKLMMEGEHPPVYTADITGLFLDSDNYADVVDHALTAEADMSSPAGTYTITVNSENLKPEKYVIKNFDGILQINAFPTVIAQQLEEATVCEGANHTFDVVGAGLELTYQWQKRVQNSWQNIDGANTHRYTISNVTAGDAGVYRVLLSGRTAVATEEVELKVAFAPANILVFEWDNVPMINCNPLTNGGHTFVSFQWYKGNTPIPGATKSYIEIDSPGLYDCEMLTSDGKTFHLCNYTATAASLALTVYPNPASAGDNVKVQLADAPQGSVINIFDLNGGLLKGNIPVHGMETTVSLSGLVSGAYVLQVVSPNGVKRTTNIVVK